MSTTRLVKDSQLTLKNDQKGDSDLSSKDADYSLLRKGHKILLSKDEYEV
ncbi:hypothetical protein [Crocosphaera sp.]|nr:hypothetical protein [Crocosphaera sp.]MDJ0580717.1 hypothetical protein [Crocosphaera sp.]